MNSRNFLVRSPGIGLLRPLLVLLLLVLSRGALASLALVQDGTLQLASPAHGSQVPPAAVRYRLEDQVLDADRLLEPEQDALWQAPPRKGLNFGMPDQAVWLRFNVRNPSAQAGRWLLVIPWSQLNRIEFRVRHGDGRWSERFDAGYDVHYSQRYGQHRLFQFPLALAADEQATVLIRVEAKYITFAPLLLWTPDAFQQQDFSDNMVYGVAFGVLLAMLLYNLLLSMVLRSSSYFLYSAYVFSIILYELAVSGYGGRYVWADSALMQGKAFSLFAAFSFFCAGLYVRNFLRLKKRGGWLLQLNTWITGYWLLSFVLTLFFTPLLLRKLGDPMALVTCVAALATTIHLWRRGDVSARYFTIAWGQLILATMGVVLMFEGVLPYDHFTEKAQVVGFVLETLLLSFALAERINRERHQRELLQQTALDMTRQASEERRAKLEAQAEALTLQQRHTDELELRVLDRTSELERTMRNLELANRELAKLSVTDPLTGLPNRRYFDEVLTSEIQRGQRQQSPLSLILVDVDHFKRINDTYGHLIGDECLRLVAATLRQVVVRGTDLVARYGGEEFAVILPATPDEDARLVAERIRAAIEKTQFIHAGKRIPIHASLGIAGRIPLQHENSARLIAAADEALYRAKETGRNRVVVAELAQR